jgi:hypothetical protein
MKTPEKFNGLHRQLRMAINCNSVLYWSSLTNRYWALPRNIGEAHNFELIKSFE